MKTTFDVRDALDDLAADTLPPAADLAGTALRRARHRRLATRGAMTGATLAIGIPIALNIATPDGAPGWTFEPAGLPNAAAQHSAADPRHLLLDDQAWQTIYADSLAYESGEITMSDGTREFELRWWLADDYESLLDDRGREGEDQALTLLGNDAVLFDSGDYFNTVWLDEGYSLEARGDGFDDLAHYMSVLGALYEADEATWRAALPADTVFAEDRADVIAEMLADIPLPNGFDASAIASAAETEGRYNVAADVSRAVMCAWTDEWITATESGDQAAVEAAVDAIATAHDWRILIEIDNQGGWSESIWAGADVFAQGLSVNEVAELYGSKEQAADPGLEVYRAPFGCDQ